MKQCVPLLLAVFGQAFAQAPTDTTKTYSLSPVTITATRTEKKLAAVPIPLTLIDKQQLRSTGNLRLNEVLQEQTGLAIVDNHGQGVQMQGFNPDYTLILVDGEPLIGRTAGTLDLSRVSVGNIKQIEIVKGPNSSLYGSEAMAGVINIITEDASKTSIGLSTRYGTNQTWNTTGDVQVRTNKWGGMLYANRYQTGGYDFSPETTGQTVEPFNNTTFQAKLKYNASARVKVGVSGRFFKENQESKLDVSEGALPQRVEGTGSVTEWTFNPSLDWHVHEQWKTRLKLYASQYETQSELHYQSDQRVYDETFFIQHFQRPEVQVEYNHNAKHQVVAGLGSTWESVEATRYEGTKRFRTTYAFAQHEWIPSAKWDVVAGARFDKHTVYGSQLSPKLAAKYALLKKLDLKASIGRGFKAPDFRQLYLNFSNAVAGYSVFGSEELPLALAQLQASNQISEVLLDPSQLGKLEAERSLAYNLGLTLQPTTQTTFTANAFRNEVSNLIETQAVARKTNGQNVFSYRNLQHIYTQGLETELAHRLGAHWRTSLGYQYLLAKDKDQVKKIKKGEVFRRDPETLASTRVRPADYHGLFGRSRHMLTAKAFYESAPQGISASIRGVYRSRYGLSDQNGNLILDDDTEFVAGYFTWHLAVAKECWKKQLRLQMGVDNLLNYRNESQIANLSGRQVWISLAFQFDKALTH